MTLTFIERKHLEDFCREHGLDVQEIDSEISYYENRQHLEEVASRTEGPKEQTEEMLAYVEQLAHDVGRRLVTEADHDKLIDIELRARAIRGKEQKLLRLKEDLERLKGEFDQKGQGPQIKTVEKIVEVIRWRTKERRKQRLIEAAAVAERLFELPTVTLPQISFLLDLDELDVLPPMPKIERMPPMT